MKVHSNKTKEKGNTLGSSKDQSAFSKGSNTLQLVDNRPNTIIQHEQQESANKHFATQKPVIQKHKNDTGLPDNLKSGIESLSGYSMNDVKVHYNSSKPAQLQAYAYAQGNQIHLGPGQERHLPHEAWHVVQQKQGRVKPTKQLKGKVQINDDSGLEKEADVMGQLARNHPKSDLIFNSSSKSLDNHLTAIQRAPMVLKIYRTDEIVDAANWDLKQKEVWADWWEEWRNIEPYSKLDNEKVKECNLALNKFKEEIRHAERYEEDNDYKLRYDYDQQYGPQSRQVNPVEVTKAEAIIDAFENSTEPLALNGDRTAIANRLKLVINNPEVMDQLGYPLCGPDTMVRAIAAYNPVVYAQYATELLSTGKGRIGNKIVVMPSSVMGKNSAGKKMDLTDWSITASLRLQKNKGYSKIRTDQNKFFLKQWHAGIAGATTLGSMKTWLLEMGVSKSDIASESKILSNADANDLANINSQFANNKAVSLMINPAVVHNKVDKDLSSAVLYRHWVLLHAPFKKISDNYIAEVLTWGSKWKIIFKASQINKALLGFLAFDPMQIQSNEDNE